uniref:Uncharacterized protein n=1 Tax=Anopheles merus TaxID=30066 RepID=A0A182US00_ANOME
MSSAAPVTVKQERHDDAEINEMAAKIVEAHKQQSAKAAAAAVQQQQVPARPAAVAATVTANGVTNGQTNILNYLTRKPTATAGNVMAAASAATTVAVPLGSGQSVTSNGSGKAYDGGGSSDQNGAEKKANDEESQKGHFGWEVFPAKVHIPFILRQQERYCAVRMVEMKLLNKYLNYLHQDIYTCTCVRSYYITEAECKLLNEINQKHCDMHFGRELFTLKDLVVRVSDAYKFYQFLEVCYKKLLMGCSTPNDKCGFIRINKESVVPYTVRDYQKMVPLFYFEGETDNLKLKADNLSGWDLSYLKFCCKVQGIRNELFASDSVAVISLTDIKGYFPPGTEFEDYWPSKVVDSQLLSGPKTNTIHWTRQPAQPPPKAPTIMANATARKAPTNNVYQTLQTQQNLAKSNNQMTSITAAALTNNWNNMVSSNHPNLLAQQEQLLRLSQAQQAAQAQAQIRNMQNMHTMQQYNSYLNSAMSLTSRTSQNQAVPPPLVRSAQVQAHLSSGGGGASSSVLRSGTSSGTAGSGNTLPNLNPALSIFATTSSPNGTVNLSRLNQQQISELTMASTGGAGMVASSGGSNRNASAAAGKSSRSSANSSSSAAAAAAAAAAIASFTAAMNSGGRTAGSSGSVSNSSSNSLDGFSLGRNVTITPAGKRGASTLDELTVAGLGSYGANGSRQPVAYPKNPISITAVPVGSPTRASPKGGQARQPPPALIPVGGGGVNNELMDSLVANGVDLLAHLRMSKDIEIINERLLEASNSGGGGGSGKQLPSYRESTNTNTGSPSVIVHDKSRASGNSSSSNSSSSRHDYTRNQSVITSAGGGNGGVASDGRTHYLNALIAAGLSDVIDLSSTQRSTMGGTTLPQHLAAAQQAAAAAYKPYEVVKKPVENKIIYCVNKTPYRNTEYLMTIFDLKDVFFPYISLEVCRRVLNALDINLFIGNSLQYQALQEAGRTNVDKMPMIQVTDVMTYMPQLQYMIRSSNLNQESQANKRARIS